MGSLHFRKKKSRGNEHGDSKSMVKTYWLMETPALFQAGHRCEEHCGLMHYSNVQRVGAHGEKGPG